MGNDKITVNDIYVMSAICAFCVANNYYNQPILMLISNSIGVTYTQIGNLPTIVQLAYAAGLLFLVPLGDKFNRKNYCKVCCLLIYLHQQRHLLPLILFF